ncbi:unnamed protein product [Cylicocyclus nassatus]|uniref:Uncharacterized protein n=1 Tax=Cylicocyclus nassatus TaxID=53992 RepID=A0AA36M5J6_CYLNA|nr:unnamed protein product [Cylicocyclus nassatus]
MRRGIDGRDECLGALGKLEDRTPGPGPAHQSDAIISEQQMQREKFVAEQESGWREKAEQERSEEEERGKPTIRRSAEMRVCIKRCLPRRANTIHPDELYCLNHGYERHTQRGSTIEVEQNQSIDQFSVAR